MTAGDHSELATVQRMFAAFAAGDQAEEFDSGTGIGVRGKVAGHELALGNTALMTQLGVDVVRW